MNYIEFVGRAHFSVGLKGTLPRRVPGVCNNCLNCPCGFLSICRASLEEDIDILYKRMTTKLIINNTGGCTWLNPVTILSQCRIKVDRFPFDPDITMRLRIKRLPLYYGLNLIIPCALIALLSFGSFFLPSDHEERVSLVVTVLLANSVYMLIVSGSLPQTSDGVPIIVVYFLSIIVEIALCLLATCVTVKICAKTNEMPDWVETSVNQRLARLVFLAPEANTKPRGARDPDETFRRLSDRERRAPAEKRNGLGSNAEPTEVELLEIGFESSSKEESSSEDIRGGFIAEIRCLTDEVRSKQARDAAAEKWRRTAKVLDRLFLLFFVFVYLILTGYLLGSM